NNLTLIEADILTINPNDLLEQINNDNKSQISNLKSQIPTPYKVVANLPYYITSAVLRHVLEAEPRPTRLVVTVQKEVADRIVAGPGRMSVLAVSVQYYGQPSLVHRIPAGAFYPAPKVDSAVVRIDTFAQPAVTGVASDHFFRVVKAGFGQKRKQLKNALTAGLGRPGSTIIEALTQAQITPTRRAETLTLIEWGRLAQALR
ncbi:MAG TPA: rRNA adenine dimethyltransferase family protein, partial [Anaerolineae bacterium]